MLFDFGPKSSVLLVFFCQAVVFSGLLLQKGIKNQNNASKWLSLFVFLGCLYIAPFMLGYANWYSQKIYREILFFIPFQQLFLIGPVLYLYAQSLLDQSFRFSKNQWIHFIPALLYTGYSLIVFITDKLILSDYYFYADGRDKDFDLWYQIAGWLSMVFYLILSLQYYTKYKKIAFETVSFANSVLFKWIQHFFIAFLALLILRILYFILNPEWGEFGSKFWYYLCFSILFYFIALSGYSNTVKSSVPIRKLSPDTPNKPSNKQNSGESIIPNIENGKAALEKLMLLNKLYENPLLTLSDVATHMETHPKAISNLINQGFQMNFNDFVNHYRIEAVIEKMKSGEQNTKTLLGIALECGFNSKATFNRAFKKNTSLSPKEFLVKLS
ncbi:AraC family transcriptional regulator [uncultured Aquimarina sp.]|uniref:helix-turn-helix domain-containing protein n=1 Tax=uncultured Aquimarina sp. TaxID=575652 RepID=UPI0026370E62|nr:AraC family transcriptional regulator [uncultured Aquimarina sp.]